MNELTIRDVGPLLMERIQTAYAGNESSAATVVGEVESAVVSAPTSAPRGRSPVQLVAGVDTRPEQLGQFCDRFAIPHRFTSLDDALAWGAFDAVTNVTPDAAHYATTLPFLSAGKHVLCEKPLATNEADADAMAAAAAKAGVVNMVNLSYRNVAALQKAVGV